MGLGRSRHPQVPKALKVAQEHVVWVGNEVVVLLAGLKIQSLQFLVYLYWQITAGKAKAEYLPQCTSLDLAFS